MTKEKVGSKILAVCWSPDGVTLAIGMQSGVISIRNQQAEELHRLERRAPVWCMIFIPGTGSVQSVSKAAAGGTSTQAVVDGDILAVGCWDKTLSMYRLQGGGHRLVSEKPLKFYPCSLALAGANGSKSNHLVVAGSNKKVMLYSRDGVCLAEIASRDSWVWGVCCCQPSTIGTGTSSSALAEADRVIVGTDGGSLEAVQLSFDSIHSLYREKYAFRESLTEIIVHNLVSDKKVRIKCKDLVKRISLYKNKLAVQLTDRVCIYESNAEESLDMHFKLRRERIMIGNSNSGQSAADSSMGGRGGQSKLVDEHDKATSMVVTSLHLLFSRSDILEVYGLDGQRIRVWRLDAPVTFMKVDGGPEGREAILLGLQTGVVVKIFVDNPFPVDLYKAVSNTATIDHVIGIDVSLYRSLVAVINSQYILTVVDLRSQEVLMTKDGVLSACFNSEVDDMLCYTSSVDSSVYVISGVGSRKTGNALAMSSIGMGGSSSSSEPQEQLQHVSGQAIGFQGQKIYCLNRGIINGADVPQSANMMRALDTGDVRGAYSIACLGATEADWKLLAIRSLRANYLDVAKNSFARLKDTKFLSLLETIEHGEQTNGGAGGGEVGGAGSRIAAMAPVGAAMSRGVTRTRGATSDIPVTTAGVGATVKGERPLDPMWQAELLAYEGHHQEAAKTFARAGKIDEAIRLLTDLRRWDDAKVFAQNAGRSDLSNLTSQQAKWLHEVNDWKGASELYVSMGQHMQAAKIVTEAAEAGWPEVLVEVVRACPPDAKDVLLFCGEAFNKNEEDAFARETFLKAGDISQLMSLYVKRQMWKEAATLAEEHEGKFDVSVFLPYAEWLVSQDRYEEAMTAFRKAGRTDLAKKVLEELTFNAVSESRFKDAAYYYWLLSREGDTAADNLPIQQQSEFEQKADLYFAYANVHTYITDPFTSSQPEMLFQVSRYIINSLGTSDYVPFGISKAATLFTLARQAMHLGAFKLAKNAYERLGKMQSLPRKQEDIEMDMLVVQAKPMRDEPEILPVCYRCASTNPLLNPFTNKFAKGDVCTNCGHPFVRSFINFGILPLVEFVPDFRISDEEAIDLIRQSGDRRSGLSGGGWKEGKEGEADTMTLDNDDDNNDRGRYGGSSSFGRDGDGDLFTKCVNIALEKQVSVCISLNCLPQFLCDLLLLSYIFNPFHV